MVSQNPFTQSVLRESFNVFQELIVAAQAGAVDNGLLSIAKRTLEAQKTALADLGIQVDAE